jgi:hypothetical protein
VEHARFTLLSALGKGFRGLMKGETYFKKATEYTLFSNYTDDGIVVLYILVPFDLSFIVAQKLSL